MLTVNENILRSCSFFFLLLPFQLCSPYTPHLSRPYPEGGEGLAIWVPLTKAAHNLKSLYYLTF